MKYEIRSWTSGELSKSRHSFNKSYIYTNVCVDVSYLKLVKWLDDGISAHLSSEVTNNPIPSLVLVKKKQKTMAIISVKSDILKITKIVNHLNWLKLKTWRKRRYVKPQMSKNSKTTQTTKQKNTVWNCTYETSLQESKAFISITNPHMDFISTIILISKVKHAWRLKGTFIRWNGVKTALLFTNMARKARALWFKKPWNTFKLLRQAETTMRVLMWSSTLILLAQRFTQTASGLPTLPERSACVWDKSVTCMLANFLLLFFPLWVSPWVDLTLCFNSVSCWGTWLCSFCLSATSRPQDTR